LKSVTTISVIDDDPMVRDATADLISSLGYTALSFESAEQFLDSGHAKNTSCLITDLQLPGLNGIELQHQLLADGYRMPVIFITGFPEAKARARALAAGATAFLAKPFEDSSLISYLESALHGSPTR
jgi:FixJ family two-component response regulator